ncbi:hypothetical protein [Nocardioides sp. P5_C9_2]
MDTTQQDEMPSGAGWSEVIDRSFGEGPTPPEPARYLAAGRAAVRRRRLATGVASLAVVAVLFGATWAALPGDARAGAGLVATDPSPSAAEASPSSSPSSSPGASPKSVRAAHPDELEILEGGPAVTSLADGTLVHLPGWKVEELVVLDDRPRHKAWGISVRNVDSSEVQWILHSTSPSTSGSTWDAPGKRFARFDDWLDATWTEQQRFEDTGPGQPVAADDSVALFVDGDVVAADGVTLLEVVMRPAEAAAYGPVEEQAAVRLRLADGSVVFGRVDAFGTTTVDPAVLDAPTMKAFLRHLAAQGDNGEGLR